MLENYLIFMYNMVGFHPLIVLVLTILVNCVLYLLVAFGLLRFFEKQRKIPEKQVSQTVATIYIGTLIVVFVTGIFLIKPLSQYYYTPDEWLSRKDTNMGQHLKPNLVTEKTRTIRGKDIVKLDSSNGVISYTSSNESYQSLSYYASQVHYFKTEQDSSPHVKLTYKTIRFAYPVRDLQHGSLLLIHTSDSTNQVKVLNRNTICVLTSVNIYLSPSDYMKQVLNNN